MAPIANPMKASPAALPPRRWCRTRRAELKSVAPLEAAAAIGPATAEGGSDIVIASAAIVANATPRPVKDNDKMRVAISTTSYIPDQHYRLGQRPTVR